MEYIRGRQTHLLERAALTTRLQNYAEVWLDLGTGDGRYIEQLAKKTQDLFLIGVDACRENLYQVSKRTPANTLFLIANAEKLPCELNNLVHRIIINFPWGSLLQGLFQAQSLLIANLRMVAREGAILEIRLNEGALRQVGLTLENGCEQLVVALASSGFAPGLVQELETAALRTYPSSWARRLGSGGIEQALFLTAYTTQKYDAHPLFQAVPESAG